MRNLEAGIAAVCIPVAFALAGCQPQTSDATSREQARQAPHVTPLSAAGRIAGVRAGALLGDQKVVQQNIQGMTRDILHDAHIPDASRPIDHEAARAAVQPLAGVRSVV